MNGHASSFAFVGLFCCQFFLYSAFFDYVCLYYGKPMRLFTSHLLLLLLADKAGTIIGSTQAPLLDLVLVGDRSLSVVGLVSSLALLYKYVDN